jgi:FkbM family methyltransferase
LVKKENLPEGQYYKKYFLLLHQFKKTWYYNIGTSRVYYDPILSGIGHRIYFDGSFEESYLKICSRYLKTDSVIFDVGANIGIHTVYFATFCPSGMIYSFEPALSTYQLLLKNINGHKNIIPINAGISNLSSSLEFYECFDNALSSLKDTKRDSIKSKYRILCFTIDDFVTLFSINKLNFVKIDVEGFETEVLQGMKGTILKYKPVIFCEVYKGKNSNQNPYFTFKLMEELNYRIYNIVSDKLEAFQIHNDNEPNYLFIPR